MWGSVGGVFTGKGELDVRVVRAVTVMESHIRNSTLIHSAEFTL